MIGQGSPKHRCAPFWLRWPPRFLARLVAALVLVLGSSLAAVEPLDVRLRLAWGGGEARAWQGTIRLSEGTLSEITPLGLEPDEPGSMQLAEDGSIRIAPRSARSYDGCDVRVQAPADAKLLVQLSAPPFVPAAPLELPLARVVRDFTQFELDDRKNRLLAQRSPGDALRITLGRSSLVFTPGEKIETEVQPLHPDIAAGGSYVLAATLTPARSDDELWTTEIEVRGEAAGSAKPVQVVAPLPEREGVFDLKLALYPKRLLTTSLVRKAIAMRSVQVVSIAPVKTAASPLSTWQSVLAFDPASPKWWEAMMRLPAWTRLPVTPRPVGSGSATTRSHLGRGWVEIGPRGWQAYPLSINAPALPHLLEVEYPSDVAQTLSISIIEPNAAGFVGPIGLDSGVDVPAAEAGHKAGERRHRLPFWPQTKTPYVLIVNRSDKHTALFGKIEVQAGPMNLPPLVLPTTFHGRLLAAYYDKPLFVENFSATEAVDPVSRRGLDDWATFFTAGQRLIETLEYSGYNAVVLSAVCEGSALYPSKLLEPTPKYDSGVFFDSGQDAVRKDVLELLLRMCDRSGIVLIPAIQFSGPLPELEALRQQGGEEAVGLDPVGPDGRTWRERLGNPAAGVYYNLLDERVQLAMRRVVQELAERYRSHASFGGVAVQLSAEEYSLLPDYTCSLDEATFQRFVKDAEVKVPSGASATPASRWAFLSQSAQEEWLEWRTQQVTAFYRQMREDIAATRPNSRLLLTTANLLVGRQLQTALRPELPQRHSPAAWMPLLGLDVSQLGGGIIVPRPQRVMPDSASPLAAQERHWNQHASLDALFSKAPQTSSLSFLPPAPLRLPEFDAASPFGSEKTRTLLISQIAPAEAASRERFVESMARMDPELMIDGGWLLPLGQEAALAPLVKVYRRLPAERFEVPAVANGSSDLVVRTLAKGERTYFYVANPTPWPLNASVAFRGAAGLQITPYGDERVSSAQAMDGGMTWNVQLEPFDLVGGELSGEAKIIATKAVAPSDAPTSLQEQIGDIKRRVHFLHDRPRAVPLANANFEEVTADGAPVHWIHAQDSAMTVAVDRSSSGAGSAALHLVNRSPAPLWVRSSAIPVPVSGRLEVKAKVRSADRSQQPQLRMAIEGRLDGQVYYQRANYGGKEREEETLGTLSDSWTTCTIARLNLPTQGLTDLRIGFDLMSAGEIWIADVQVVDLWLQESEYNELLKSISTAKYQLEGGRLNECRLLTRGYWPSFLRRHVQLSGGAEPSTPAVLPTASSDAARSKTSFLPPAITLPKAPPRAARSAEHSRTWWPSWMKWK